MTAQEHALQSARYTEALSRHDPRAVRAAVDTWGETRSEWPSLSDLLDVVREKEGTLQRRAETRALPAPPEDLWAADYRQLGVGLQIARGKLLMGRATVQGAAGEFNRMVGALGGLDLARALADETYHRDGHEAVLPALLKAAGIFRGKDLGASHESIRETCRMVEAIRGEPERFLAARSLIAMGETLIARHIAAGRAPADVANWYGHLVEQHAEALGAAA